MKRWKILAIEDEPDILHGLVLRLEAAGYEVRTAADGLAAMRQASRETPDLILLDIGLPGDSGHKVAARLRNMEGTSATPIIYLTASAGGDDIRQARALGVQRYITKPFDGGYLLRAMAELLTASSATVSALE